MLIKKIIQLCKKQKKIILYDSEDVQYISDGAAVYPLHGMPVFDEKSILTAFDIAGDKIEVQRFGTPPAMFDLGDSDAAEIHVEGPLLVVGDNVPYLTSVGVRFIEREHLAPFADEKVIDIYERSTPNGDVYFVVKKGFLVLGAISAKFVLTVEWMKRLMKLETNCRKTFITMTGGLTPSECEPEEFV